MKATISLAATVCALFHVSLAAAAELKAEHVLSTQGDGPDGKGNSADDTWQFWFELAHARGRFGRLTLATSKMSEQQRAKGIRRKVTGPIAGWMPDKENVEGWILHTDWDGRFEGVWGNKKTGQVYAYPYVEKGSHCAVAVTFTVPETGTYRITGQLIDAQVFPHKRHDGIYYRIAVAPASGGKGRVVAQGGPFGDKEGRPDLTDVSVSGVQVKKGQHIRLAIVPGKWWGSDMCQIENLKIEKE